MTAWASLAARSATQWAAPQLPVQPDREQAADWAREELANAGYQQARSGQLAEWLDRGVQTLLDWLSRADAAGSDLGTLAVLTVLVLVGGWLLWRYGGRPMLTRRTAAAVHADPQLSAEQYRAMADAAAAAGDYHGAVIARFRALVRDLEQRTLLAPNRTTREVQQVACTLAPDQQQTIIAAVAAFEDARYGDLTMGAAQDELLKVLDRQLSTARPQPELIGGPQ